MNGHAKPSAYEPSIASFQSGDSLDACESFLESYSRGNIDVGGEQPPEIAKQDIPLDILLSGDFAAPLPPDDHQRVRELYQYRILKELNHDAKLGLDRFVRLATLVCDAKIAIINFLDDRTQFTSSEVAPAQFLMHTSIPRPLSMCTHTILKRSPDIFEVPDLTKDWRFRNRSYVIGEPYIRYYAGAPLRTKSGFNIGTLCLLDYTPKQLNSHQTAALKDLANMIITDLELHRDKELVDLKGRMANSITQFTRGLIKREGTIPEKQRAVITLPSTRRKVKRGKGPSGWIKKTPTADEAEKDPLSGVMGFYDFESVQKSADTSPTPLDDNDSTEETTTDNESDATDSQNLEEIELKAMYRYACRLMRETLDVEGVCFIDIDGIDWKHALGAPIYRDDQNSDTHTSGPSRREFGPASSILGYSHSPKFGAKQREIWPSIARWDDEASTSDPQRLRDSRHGSVTPTRHATNYQEAFGIDHVFSSQTGPSIEDASFVSAKTVSHYDNGGFSNQFLAEFLRENPFGKIYNDGLPDEIQDFLPKGVVSAILLPIFDFDHHPFAMTCTYSSSKHKKFSEEEKQYLEGFGSQILSQVLKKRIIMADRAKGIFISNISHELRSPLHGILASAEFLADTRLDTLQRTFIDTIDSCGRTLLEVINHVLDFGKLTYIARLKNKIVRPQIERSTSSDVIPQQINVAPADLMAVTEQVAESCYAGYEFKGLFGQVDIGSILDESKPANDVGRPRKKGGYGRAKDPTSALTLIIDVEYREQGWFFLLQSGAVQRILMNITGNALKYTPAGWVRVHLSSTESDGHTTVHLTVSDSGKGISSEFLRTRLFSPFSQEDTLQTGTGLGMSIVKQVVDRLGGQINVQSQVGLGSQVHVSLPADAVDRDTDDSCTRVRARSNGLKAFLAGFDKNVPASRLLYESMATYLTKWYNIDLVEDVHSSDLIISDECPELLDYFQQTSPADRSAFSPPFCTSPSALSPSDLFAVSTPESFHNVYRAWQPLIVLCSNALRYELYGQQAESGKIIDFSSKPCGPYKLARSILFCLDQAETRRKSLEAEMEQTHISSPLIHSETSSSTATSVSDKSDSGSPAYPRRGSFGRGVVRFSPTVRRGSSDLGASMYVAGRGFVPTLTSSIVEPQRFVGMRRKSAIASPQITPSSEGDINFNLETRHHIPHSKHTESEQISFKMPTYPRPPPSKSSVTPPRAQTPSPSVPRKNTSVPVSPTTDTKLSTPRPPSVLIVEDNSVNALILATFLRKRGYPFVQAENGLLAVQAVQSRPEGFDVILMDIQMPVMDGSAATASIRSLEQQRPSTRPAYIVALTGLAADKDRQLAFQSGVDHFLTKPVSLKQLGVVIDDWEKRDEERGSMKSDFLEKVQDGKHH